MATNGLRIRVQGDILYKNHPVDIAEQKKSFILLDCVIIDEKIEKIKSYRRKHFATFFNFLKKKFLA